MTTRRDFIGTGLAGIAALTLLPAVNTFASVDNDYNRHNKGKLKLRFALASDIHYGQPNTDYATNTGNMVK